MFKKIALALAVLLTASSAWAFETFPNWEPKTLNAGGTATQILDTGGGSTYSNALSVSNVSGILVSFDPDRLTTGGASVITLHWCPDDNDATASTRCSLITTLSAQLNGEYFPVTEGYLRTFKSTAPAGSIEALVKIKALSDAAGGGGTANTLATDGTMGKSVLIVGDLSIIFGRPYDEPWAHANGRGYNDQFAGYVSRSRQASGAGGTTQDVEAGITLSTGNLFGGSPSFDLLSYVRKNKRDVLDVVLHVGTSDFIQPNCSHSPGGGAFNPSLTPSLACTPDETIENLQYLMGELNAMGVASYWFMPPSWVGKWMSDAAPGLATYVDAIEDIDDALDAFCAGKSCFSSTALYEFACAGQNAPDPVGNPCNTTLNLYDVGDGSGFVNLVNVGFLFGEDATVVERVAGAGLYLHPNGMGYTEFHRLMWNEINTLNGGSASFRLRQIFGVGSDNIDWSARPGIPGVSLGTITSTSIEVTPTRGLYVDGNSGGGADGRCGKLEGDCTFVCWATCEDDTDTSTDPACATTATGSTPDFRQPGAPNGASHYLEGTNNSLGTRNYITLKNGETGVLRGLATNTVYGVYCVAVSPSSVSHPGYRSNITP